MRLGAQAIDVLTAGTLADEYHNVVPDWTAPTTVAVTGCSVQPGGGSQDVTDREAVTTLFTVWAPPSAVVADTSRIRYAGSVFDIDGPVERWATGNPLDHLVIRLKAVSG